MESGRPVPAEHSLTPNYCNDWFRRGRWSLQCLCVVSMYVSRDSVYTLVYVCVWSSMHVCVCVCVHMYMFGVYVNLHSLHTCVCVSMSYPCMHVCVCGDS